MKILDGRFGPLSVAVLALGCASSHPAVAKRDQYAQATCTDSLTCCVQRNPGNPEACGLTASEAATLMAGARATAPDDAAEWNDSHNAQLPEWKRLCIRNYGDCKEDGWKGDCYACLRYCEGQLEWPADQCFPAKKKGK
ncbi:hypothetical protein LY474_24945 [Myxococcus stipitatus]|nr:hypothetical protein [Myxococcus stipitatus]